MESINTLKKIQAWFNGPQDFTTGLNILRLVSKKHRLIGKLSRGGLNNTNTIIYKRSHEKLAHELGLLLRPGTYQKANSSRFEDPVNHHDNFSNSAYPETGDL